LPGKTIEVRGPDDAVAEAAGVAVSEIIRGDEEDVGPLIRRGARRRRSRYFQEQSAIQHVTHLQLLVGLYIRGISWILRPAGSRGRDQSGVPFPALRMISNRLSRWVSSCAEDGGWVTFLGCNTVTISSSEDHPVAALRVFPSTLTVSAAGDRK